MFAREFSFPLLGSVHHLLPDVAHAYAATDIRVVDGANLGEAITTHDDFVLEDAYGLSRQPRSPIADTPITTVSKLTLLGPRHDVVFWLVLGSERTASLVLGAKEIGLGAAYVPLESQVLTRRADVIFDRMPRNGLHL